MRAGEYHKRETMKKVTVANYKQDWYDKFGAAKGSYAAESGPPSYQFSSLGRAFPSVAVNALSRNSTAKVASDT